uniref:Protein RALF-like 32 n=1 Tax=Rhizophora mucronata TaxID=61149 RepID=A0A2P2NM63_RHIMU
MEPKSLNVCVLIALGLFYLGPMSNKVSWASQVCNASIAECNEEYEVLMATEISRRFLEHRKYISPGVLHRDQPVCSGGKRGQSYSSGCLPPKSNPGGRGCSRIYRCRSDS